MQEYNNFIGTGHNPYGPDLPLGFGMQLAQEPKAMEAYGSLSNEKKTSVIRYIQSGTTGEDAKNRIAKAIEQLNNSNPNFFNM